MITRAQKGHFYYKIGDKGGQLYLSGATARWKRSEYSRYIYIPSLRIAGNPEDLKSLLQSNAVSEKEIKEYLVNAYNSQNVNVSVKNGGMFEKYDAELNEYAKFRESQTDVKETNAGPSVTLGMLSTLLDSIQQAEPIRTVRTTKTASTAGTATSGAKRPGRRVPFSQRISNLRTGQVLDVSNMREDGTGAKIIAQPGNGSGKMGCTLVAGIVSSNLETFRLALQQLNLTPEQQQQCLAQWQANRAVSTSNSNQSAGRARGRKAATAPAPSIASPSKPISLPNAAGPSIPTLVPSKPAPLAGSVSPRPPTAARMPIPTTAPMSRIPSLSTGKRSPVQTKLPSISGMSSLPTLPSLTSPRAMGH